VRVKIRASVSNISTRFSPTKISSIHHFRNAVGFLFLDYWRTNPFSNGSPHFHPKYITIFTARGHISTARTKFNMVAFEENRASSAPPNEEREIVNEKHHDSDASSTTKAEDTSLERDENDAPPPPHAHPRFGDNQVFAPNNDDSDELPKVEKAGTYDKIELTEDMCYDELGYSYPSWKKW
jgi:hypothetical protein